MTEAQHDALRVEVGGAAPYAVQVGTELLASLEVPQLARALLYDERLPASLVQSVRGALGPTVEVALPSGEACKTLAVMTEVLSRLARANLPRDGAVVGLGGGATTDLAGFVAASYLRGVAFHTVPTTLLGMVDAAVGGKTGVNLPEGKNLVGAFWPPASVTCDLGTLDSLPAWVFREGAAEVFKHGLIADATLLPRVLHADFRAGGPGLARTVADAIRVKADVVTRDLTEQGERAFLNFGHTLAHALEAVTRHGVPHGEAVGYGLHYAALLSLAVGGADVTAHTRSFLAWQRPAPLPELTFEDVWPFMARDKKADHAGVRFVLLHEVGRPYLARVPEGTLRACFDAWRADVRGMTGADMNAEEHA
ncbi:3-dehydroquinate synthase [Deinococcus maricopensis]|uniref:3-dehydroquinate synthase n=1 Tax=Deinococcus maricopensis (strain DSM 21211 / LMG 22137 / NRRL B-23946 / LB-34) TaxID=709986 RepID=E8U7Z7_DEIML|nr:3-dehydroquinate synthase [Deinococcus maricopensis]ADV67186.1 3-dehydroquinate synthase [Deinococcus maricopensis DSM 21211]